MEKYYHLGTQNKCQKIFETVFEDKFVFENIIAVAEEVVWCQWQVQKM